ncbi:MAG: SDR family oxidoreductase [Comamonadaceae bacterium]|nr:SDR family oxidoreductase [Comamonadaceae bacterium]
MELKDKVIVISGAASGLGWGAARFAAEVKGARVVLLDRDGIQGRLRAAELDPERSMFLEADLADRAQVASALEAAISQFGSIDACFSFAGVVGPMRILDRSGKASALEDFERTVRINLVGTFNLLATCAEHMARNEPNAGGERGVLVAISSGAAFDGQVGQSAYSASKAGLVGLCLPAARELAPLGIRINSIAPGAFWTPMLASLPQRVVDDIASGFQFPKRFGEPEEIASLCCYIAENSYLNGECLRLDGAFRLPPR